MALLTMLCVSLSKNLKILRGTSNWDRNLLNTFLTTHSLSQMKTDPYLSVQHVHVHFQRTLESKEIEKNVK